MKQYLELLREINDRGLVKTDRTGTGTKSLFGKQMRFNLQEGLPRLTTKFVPAKTVFNELKWMLEGSTNNERLRLLNGNQDPTIWEEWADPNGELGPIYGEQWRRWPIPVEMTSSQEDAPGYYFLSSVDQIADVIKQLKTTPDSRRLIVSAWNVGQINHMKLPPCHAFFQFYTRELTIAQRDALCDLKSLYRGNPKFGEALRGDDPQAIAEAHAFFDAAYIPRRYLDCQLYQRSADMFLGVPFNILSYSFLIHLMAHHCGMLPGEFIWTGGDCHIYSNHTEQVALQLSREPMTSPQLKIKCAPKPLEYYKWEDLEISNYEHWAHIPAPVAV
jgi:thymidylate synthase